MTHRNLNVLDAAQQVAALINELIDGSPRGHLLHVSQMRKSVQSIVANISEAFGREPGRERDHSLEIARGETEEAIGHLKANFKAHRVKPKDYWPGHNRLVVIVKMLNGLLNH